MMSTRISYVHAHDSATHRMHTEQLTKRCLITYGQYRFKSEDNLGGSNGNRSALGHGV